MKVVAEGVEAVEQAAMLSGRDCDAAQGYLFAKPLTSPDVETSLKEYSQNRSGFHNHAAVPA